ncbi:MAG: delta-aminolevulinic acid dehydratase, partial [Syntrophaceae bacterium]
MEPVVGKTIRDLLDYCERNEWAGFDPFDGLNSRVFQALPFFSTRITRLVLTQAMKRMPINLRNLLLIPKGEKPKGLAVF